MIFSEDTNSFSLKVTPTKSGEIFHSGLWLILTGINETPPHIALVVMGKYYSLSTRKVDCGTSLERFMNTLERKHIPTLFIQIEIKANLILLVEDIYKDLKPLKDTKSTCLSPIKQLFANAYSQDFLKVDYVFELIALAEQQQLVKECISVFCNDTDSKSITLPKYNMKQIKNRITEIASRITSVNPPENAAF